LPALPSRNAPGNEAQNKHAFFGTRNRRRIRRQKINPTIQYRSQKKKTIFAPVSMEKTQQIITQILDFFYPIFSRFLNKQTYYYLACGGGNTLFGLVLYYLFYHYYFQKSIWDLGFIAFESHIASFILSFSITFPIGFFLSRYVVWSESSLRGRTQLVRHLIFVIISVFMNYGLLKLFVEIFHWWAMPSQILTTVIIVIFSYISQRFISFKQ
jgi:putative flippase GtrA